MASGRCLRHSWGVCDAQRHPERYDASDGRLALPAPERELALLIPGRRRPDREASAGLSHVWRELVVPVGDDGARCDAAAESDGGREDGMNNTDGTPIYEIPICSCGRQNSAGECEHVKRVQIGTYYPPLPEPPSQSGGEIDYEKEASNLQTHLCDAVSSKDERKVIADWLRAFAERVKQKQ